MDSKTAEYSNPSFVDDEKITPFDDNCVSGKRSTTPFNNNNAAPPNPEPTQETKDQKQLSTFKQFFTINRHLLPAKIASFLNLGRFAIAEYTCLFYIAIGKSLSILSSTIVSFFRMMEYHFDPSWKPNLGPVKFWDFFQSHCRYLAFRHPCSVLITKRKPCIRYPERFPTLHRYH